MKYITVEERELFDKLIEKYNIKGYSVPNSLMCQRSYPKTKEDLKSEKKRKTT